MGTARTRASGLDGRRSSTCLLRSLAKLPAVGELRALTTLDLGGCCETRRPAGRDRRAQRTTLDLSWCSSLAKILREGLAFPRCPLQEDFAVLRKLHESECDELVLDRRGPERVERYEGRQPRCVEVKDGQH